MTATRCSGPRSALLLPALVLATAIALLSGCGSDPSSESGGPTPSAVTTSSGTSAGTPDRAPASASGSTSAATTAGATAPATGAVALFFGDSNFVGGGCTPDPQQDMAQIAANQLGYQAVIRGEGGTGFASGNPTYGAVDFVEQIARGALDVSPAPQLVVIEGGSNDTGTPLDAVTHNVESVLQTAQRTYPDARVVLMGPIDVRAGEDDVTPSINGALQFAAGQVGVSFIDAYDWLPWRTTDGLLCSDFDHATLAGHQILGQKLADALTQLGV